MYMKYVSFANCLSIERTLSGSENDFRRRIMKFGGPLQIAKVYFAPLYYEWNS